MYCASCGKHLPEDANFCSNCGRPTHDAPSSTEREGWEFLEILPLFRGPSAVSGYAAYTFVGRKLGPYGQEDLPLVEVQLPPGQLIDDYGYYTVAIQPRLEEMSSTLRELGWQPQPRGQHWYSYHFRRRWDPARVDPELRVRLDTPGHREAREVLAYVRRYNCRLVKNGSGRLEIVGGRLGRSVYEDVKRLQPYLLDILAEGGVL